jgi:hypothetical protein
MTKSTDQFVEIFTGKVVLVKREGSARRVVDVLDRERDAHTQGAEVTVKKEGHYRLSDPTSVSDKNFVGKEHLFGVDHGEKLFVIKHINHQP